MATEEQAVQFQTPWQRMSRHANYRQRRTCRRIKERWATLPLFKDREILELGFIRLVHHKDQDKCLIGFNANYILTPTFDEAKMAAIVKGLSNPAPNEPTAKELSTYLDAVKRVSGNRISVYDSIRFIQHFIQNASLEQASDELFRRDFHHHLFNLYRRLPYQRALNTPIFERYWKFGANYPVTFIVTGRPDAQLGDICFVSPEPGAKGSAPFAKIAQEDFLPLLPKSAVEPEIDISLVIDAHKKLQALFDTTGALTSQSPTRLREDSVGIAIPLYETSSATEQYGALLGHLLLRFRLDNFYDTQDNEYRTVDEGGRSRPKHLNELSERARARLWEKMALWDSDFRRETSPNPKSLEWQIVSRDLNEMARVFYESELQEWLHEQAEDELKSQSPDRILAKLVSHVDGWTATSETGLAVLERKSLCLTPSVLSLVPLKVRIPLPDARTNSPFETSSDKELHLTAFRETKTPTGFSPSSIEDLGAMTETGRWLRLLAKRYQEMFRSLELLKSVEERGELMGNRAALRSVQHTLRHLGAAVNSAWVSEIPSELRRPMEDSIEGFASASDPVVLLDRRLLHDLGVYLVSAGEAQNASGWWPQKDAAEVENLTLQELVYDAVERVLSGARISQAKGSALRDFGKEQWKAYEEIRVKLSFSDTLLSRFTIRGDLAVDAPAALSKWHVRKNTATAVYLSLIIFHLTRETFQHGKLETVSLAASWDRGNDTICWTWNNLPKSTTPPIGTGLGSARLRQLAKRAGDRDPEIIPTKYSFSFHTKWKE